MNWTHLDSFPSMVILLPQISLLVASIQTLTLRHLPQCTPNSRTSTSMTTPKVDSIAHPVSFVLLFKGKLKILIQKGDHFISISFGVNSPSNSCRSTNYFSKLHGHISRIFFLSFPSTNSTRNKSASNLEKLIHLFVFHSILKFFLRVSKLMLLRVIIFIITQFFPTSFAALVLLLPSCSFGTITPKFNSFTLLLREV